MCTCEHLRHGYTCTCEHLRHWYTLVCSWRLLWWKHFVIIPRKCWQFFFFDTICIVINVTGSNYTLLCYPSYEEYSVLLSFFSLSSAVSSVSVLPHLIHNISTPRDTRVTREWHDITTSSNKVRRIHTNTSIYSLHTERWM